MYDTTRTVCLSFQEGDGHLCTYGACHGCNLVYGSGVGQSAYLKYQNDGQIIEFYDNTGTSIVWTDGQGQSTFPVSGSSLPTIRPPPPYYTFVLPLP